MGPYIFGIRNQVHILDLQQTVPMLDRPHAPCTNVTAAGGACCSSAPSARRGRNTVADAANRCGQ